MKLTFWPDHRMIFIMNAHLKGYSDGLYAKIIGK